MQLFLLNSIIAQTLQFDCNFAHWRSHPCEIQWP